MPINWTPISYTSMRQGDKTLFFGGHQFYKDANGDFQDVDYQLADMGAYWELSKASYRLRIAKDFGASQLLQYTNRYEGANHQITYEPSSIWWVDADSPSTRTLIRTSQSVLGSYNSNTQTVTWLNAFGNGIDFEVVIQRSGFKKNVIINSAPPAGPYVNNYLLLLFTWGATGLTLKDSDGTAWDNNKYFEASDFTIEEAGNPLYKTFIQRAKIFDADGRSKDLRVMFEKRTGTLYQGKIIPESLLQQAIYPVRADTLTTFYSGAGDGHVGYWSAGAGWDSVHNSLDPGGLGTVSYTATIAKVLTFKGPSTQREVNRLFLPFDTSGLPDGDAITAANLKVYPTLVENAENDGDDFISVVETSQASPTVLTTDDYDTCGATHSPTELIDTGQRKDLTNISAGAYISFPLNATGLSVISKTGWTTLGLREGHDLLDHQPNQTGAATNGLTIATSEETGTTKDPFLEITHGSLTDNLTATGIATTPSVGTPTIAQNHALSATGIATTPSVGTPTVTQNHTLSAISINSTPVIDSADIAQWHILDTADLTTTPVIDSVDIAQWHILDTVDLTTTPVIDSVDIAQWHILDTADLTTTPVIDSADITQSHTLDTADLTTTPVIDSADITQLHTLDTADLTTTPILGTPSMSGEYALVAIGITISPIVGTPALTEDYNLIAVGIDTTPIVGTPIITLPIQDNLTATGIITTPVVGAPLLFGGLQEHYHFIAIGITTQNPTVGKPWLKRVHTLDTNGILTIPSIGMPMIGQAHTLIASGITTSPIIGLCSFTAILGMVSIEFRTYSPEVIVSVYQPEIDFIVPLED